MSTYAYCKKHRYHYGDVGHCYFCRKDKEKKKALVVLCDTCRFGKKEIKRYEYRTVEEDGREGHIWRSGTRLSYFCRKKMAYPRKPRLTCKDYASHTLEDFIDAKSPQPIS